MASGVEEPGNGFRPGELEEVVDAKPVDHDGDTPILQRCGHYGQERKAGQYEATPHAYPLSFQVQAYAGITPSPRPSPTVGRGGKEAAPSPRPPYRVRAGSLPRWGEGERGSALLTPALSHRWGEGSSRPLLLLRPLIACRLDHGVDVSVSSMRTRPGPPRPRRCPGRGRA